MAEQQLKRWRPRFSVRTFLVLVTLACGYAACWWPTKHLGEKDVANTMSTMREFMRPVEGYRYFGAITLSDPQAVLPLVVSTTEVDVESNSFVIQESQRRYYFWFFGYVAKLPYERKVSGFHYRTESNGVVQSPSANYWLMRVWQAQSHRNCPHAPANTTMPPPHLPKDVADLVDIGLRLCGLQAAANTLGVKDVRMSAEPG